jgi:hypothetical protein
MSQVNVLQLKKTLAEIDYPTSKHDLVKCAELTGVDEKILRQLKRLPEHQYETLENVRQAIDEME